MKQHCKDCKLEKDIEDFYLAGNGDQRRTDCKECAMASRRLRHLKNPEKARNQRKKYYETHKREHAEYCLRKVKESPKKHYVRKKVYYAVKTGKLKKLPCQYPNCKYHEKRIEAHHWDYDKPLEVVWLCSLHHAMADKVYKLIQKHQATHH